MEKILVTGVAGFIGSRVALRFIREGYHVVGVDDLSSGNMSNIPDGVEFIRGDLSSPAIINLLPRDCRKILHLAGQSSGEISFDNPIVDLEKNTFSTLNLIHYGIDINVERFVYASSMSIYGKVPDEPIHERYKCKPLSCYGVGKQASEGYLRVYQKHLPYVSLRMFNVYGPGQDLSNLRQGMVSIYVAQAIKDCKIEVKGSVNRFRDFIFIDDVVEAWYRASTLSSALYRTVNLGTGIRTSVLDLLETITRMVPGTTYYIEGTTPGDQDGIFPDVGLLKECLGINSFVSIDEGIKFFLEWAYKSNFYLENNR